MRCPRCGNENPPTHRFCGMCGTSLLQATAPVQAGLTAKPPAAEPASAAPANAAPPATPPPSPPAAEEPVISGPSFLGLNQRAPARPRRVTLSIDPHSETSSRNLDYLLEDDEEPKRGGGAWKYILIVVALALALGFGYLRWRNQTVPSLRAGANKPSAASESSQAPDAGTPGSPAASPTAGTSQAASPGTNAAAASATAGSPPSVPPASASSASASPAANPVSGSAPPSATPDSGASGAGSAGSAATQPPAATPMSPPPATSAPKPLPAQPLPKPPAAVAPAPDPIARAQRYIYGKGVPQDCDRGLRILKPSADQGNPKAMVEMGALYSAGLCTPRDLPTSYRWFALALRKDPNNQSLQADLNKLWGEMTQPERQLAIKLSQ